MVTQMSAASPSPLFHSERSYVKKISVYFLVICANFLCKIEKFELESGRCGYFRDRVLLSGHPLTYLQGAKSEFSKGQTLSENNSDLSRNKQLVKL